jgi:Mg2+-importing ATPase
MLIRNFTNPFVVVLLILGTVSYLTGDRKAVIVVTVMVTVSVILRFIQEYRSSRAAEKLEAMVRTTATVRRQHEEEEASGVIRLVSKAKEIPIQEIVSGDIIELSAGDMIPADARLIESKDLFVSQSVLTGEALPVEKHVTLPTTMDKASRETSDPLSRCNLCFLGTNAVSGHALAAVVATGSSTMIGHLAKSVTGHRSETSFDRGVNSVSWVLIRFMLVMTPVIFLLNGFMKGDWRESFLFAVAVAVGLTPEMLPMVVTANLAKGALTMSKEKVIVKKLNAIQNLGAMDILCTDKTGTLTQDKIVLIKYMDVQGKENASVLEYVYLNSCYQTGLKNLLDRAVLERGEKTKDRLLESAKKVDEIPFDFARRRMSVVVQKKAGEHLLICKGAIEEIVQICSHVDDAGGRTLITDVIRKKALSFTGKLNEDGLRVVAVAYKTLPAENRAYTLADEQGLTLAGFVDFLDPPKETAAPSLKALREDGISVKIITGDNDVIARRICRDVQLPVEHIAIGDDIEGMTDEALADLAERTTVFAKINPMQKARIVRALKAKGHTVGFLGDGINDAAALRDSDVGISVDSGADIAKESADIILLEKSLLVLQTGVIKGREVYGNIIKYIKMTASSNFGNMFSMLAASAFLPFLPMLPIQLLIQNLCYDISQLSTPWDRMNREFLEKPRKWEPKGIARFMLFIGPISSIFDITTFLILWFVFGARTPASQALFQSGWFVEGLLSQTLIVHMIRTPKIPFFQSLAAPPVLLLTTAMMAIGIAIPFTSFGHSVGMIALPGAFFPWLLGTLVAYFILGQLVKMWYIRRFGAWL